LNKIPVPHILPMHFTATFSRPEFSVAGFWSVCHVYATLKSDVSGCYETLPAMHHRSRVQSIRT